MINKLVSGTFPFASFSTQMFRALLLMALMLISQFTHCQILFTVNTGFLTRHVLIVISPQRRVPLTIAIRYYHLVACSLCALASLITVSYLSFSPSLLQLTRLHFSRS